MNNIFLGEHDIEDGSETVTFKSKAINAIVHDLLYWRISSGDLEYDVGMVTLETPVNFADPKFNHIR